MIQLNLLPDVKMQYVNAQRARRFILTVSVIVCAVAIVILVILLGVDGLQKKHLDDINKDISSETSQLKGEPNISTILTVQNQLNSLTTLHEQKPAASRVFNYLEEVTPVQESLNNFSVDFNQHTMSITGTSNSLTSVNQFIDILKDTTYSSPEFSSNKDAFSNVVLSTFGVGTSTSNSGQAVSYTISLNFDPNIFDISQNVTLSVPSQTISYLDVSQPSSIFTDTTNNSSGGGN